MGTVGTVNSGGLVTPLFSCSHASPCGTVPAPGMSFAGFIWTARGRSKGTECEGTHCCDLSL